MRRLAPFTSPVTLRPVIRNVIFDWSGTLVDDLPAVWEATNHVLRQAGREPISLERFRDEFTLPFTGFYQTHTPDVPMDRLEEWFHARFREVQHSVRELPHARAFLEFCRARQLRTALLSTMHPDHFAVQTRAIGFDRYLDHPYLGVWDKRRQIHALLDSHAWLPDETLFIGDMEHDIETARHGGVRSVAVLTGYTASNRLRAAGPDLVVEHLGELQAILSRHHLDLPNPSAPASTDPARRRPIVTVGAAIFRDDGRVLMIRTHKWSSRWGIPGGKVEFGETSEDALRRELREETGLDVDAPRFVLVQDCIRSPEFYREEHFVLLNYRCHAPGNPDVRLNDEAQSFRWVTPAEALAMDLNEPTRILLNALAQPGPLVPPLPPGS
ncbi:MAG: NUDIX domain-containing protein [Verrucomicrobiae bacterium]|nr:NUDIX domain-containing protein [Verrucomicrobiae bacterium]